jgi:hypothetical protein
MITARLKARKNGDVVTVLRFQILLHLHVKNSVAVLKMITF